MSVQLPAAELVVPADDDEHLSVENALAKTRPAAMGASPDNLENFRERGEPQNVSELRRNSHPQLHERRKQRAKVE
ncbi:hypothetical protein GN244_ATG19201 [Phytophthora infestans]|uniref:Uncharacterized protein n=1 Tax=Phytophthora infestans TaxID=4787 RepID=A0A833S7J4_PHYIN|nr:hypothetical protein GN244_ATG19201 [Phytophthora infestans]